MLYIACAVLWLLRFALGASIFSFLGVCACCAAFGGETARRR